MHDPMWQSCSDYSLTGLHCHTLILKWIHQKNAKVEGEAQLLDTYLVESSSVSDSICSQAFVNLPQSLNSESS